MNKDEYVCAKLLSENGCITAEAMPSKPILNYRGDRVAPV